MRCQSGVRGRQFHVLFVGGDDSERVFWQNATRVGRGDPRPPRSSMLLGLEWETGRWGTILCPRGTTMNIRRTCLALFSVCITVAGGWVGRSGAAAQSPAAAVDFQRDVRPILADNCFQCHGPDESSRQAGLRLDIRDGAFEERSRGAAVVSSDVDASLLYQRIVHSDERRRMPPRAANKTLSDDQIDVLRRWISEGASWDQHWSFEAITRPAPPVVRQ